MIVTKHANQNLPAPRKGETDWQIDCKPTRSGVYRRVLPGIGVRFSHFSVGANRWMIGSFSVKEAGSKGRLASGFQNVPWCGLAENPDAR